MQNNSEIFENEKIDVGVDIEVTRKRYISPDEGQKIVEDASLI